MLKSLVLALALTFPIAVHAESYDHQPDLNRITADLERGDAMALATRGDQALEAMMDTAARWLTKHGQEDDARILLDDFALHAQGYLSHMLLLKDIGDHTAYSQWLEDRYDWLEERIGPEIMHLLHLDDIKVMNYAVVVVFHMKKLGPDVIDLSEYGRHFMPFSGVIAYWGTWIGCEIATYSSGWFLICTPAGMIVKYLVVSYVAPKFSPLFYRHFYP